MRQIMFSLAAAGVLFCTSRVALAQSLHACVGTGAPNIADGVFDCTSSDIVPGSGEVGNFLFLAFDSAGSPVTLTSITLDFGPSAGADIVSRFSFAPDNLDGVTIASENLSGNVYTGNFNNFAGGTDLFVLGFNFDKRSLGTGTPLGGDYTGATIVATLSNGSTLNGSFTQVDFFIASASLGVAGGSVDVWIKDCEADDGDTPSYPAPCPEYWKSPDIFLDNNGDLIIDAPVIGMDNTLKAIVRNRGAGIAQDVTVSFYYRDNTTGLVFPDGATLIGTTTVTVPSNGVTLASVVWHNLPAPPSTGGHWCIGVVLSHPNDLPITPTAPPYADNNVGIANIWFIAGRAGEQVVLSFNAGTGGRSGFGLEPWPRDFIVKVNARLPVGWTWTLKGIEPDKPFTLKLGEDRPVQLEIKVAGDAQPHADGFIEVTQIDVATDRAFGGVHFNIYEDHQPPEKVRKVIGVLANGQVVLTWERVQLEAKTGLKERVAFYQILRDGKVVGKTFTDEDPLQFGMQWTDRAAPPGQATYTIQVVDEAGNTSEGSPGMSIFIPGPKQTVEPATLFNWLTWTLLILVLVLAVTLLTQKSRHGVVGRPA
jgi:hypothetical protein